MSFVSDVYHMPKGAVTRVYEGPLGTVRETRKFSEMLPVNIDANRDRDARAPLSLAAQMMDLFRRCYFYLAGYTRVTLEVSLKSNALQTQLTEFYVLKKELNAVDANTNSLAKEFLKVRSLETDPSATNSEDLQSLTNRAIELQKDIKYLKKGIDTERKGDLPKLIAEEQRIQHQIAALLTASQQSTP